MPKNQWCFLLKIINFVKMKVQNKMERGVPVTEKQGKIFWHSGNFSALQLELLLYLGYLKFIDEKQLSKEPLIMDALVIKKDPDVVIEKNIGRIFKEHNLIEFKSEKDYLSVSDYKKVANGYAGIYASFEDVDYSDMTVTFIVNKKPVKLFKELVGRGFSIKEVESGIYYLEGEHYPVQIIEIKKLDSDANIYLRSLRSDVTREEAEKLVSELIKHNAWDLASPLLNNVAEANVQIFKEVMNMSDEVAKQFTEVLRKKGTLDKLIEETKLEGKLENKQETALNMLQKGLDTELIADCVKMPVEWVQSLRV